MNHKEHEEHKENKRDYLFLSLFVCFVPFVV